MGDDGKNAVTWGVFPGKEIVQTTIIERESFLAWKVFAPKLRDDATRANVFPGCGVFTMGGLAISLHSSVARARITRECSKGEVVGQYRPSGLYSNGLALGFFVRFVDGDGERRLMVRVYSIHFEEIRYRCKA